jgi:geranylgeranyl diphosphate synthase type I
VPGGARTNRVAAALTSAIRVSGATPEFADLLRRLLSRPGFALAAEGVDRWAPYVFETAEALGSRDDSQAVVPAAAVECTVASIDVADDLLDDEWDDLEVDRGRALNGSVALAFLGQYCASQLPARAHAIQHVLASGALASCDGQDLDLLLEAVRDDIEEQRALQATLRKSGSLGAMACQVGAAVCTDDPRTLDLIGAFGRHLGTCAQLLNDLAGVDIEQSAGTKSDLRRRKKTVPVAYLLACARRDGPQWVLDWYKAPASSRQAEEPALRQLQRLLPSVRARRRP